MNKVKFLLFAALLLFSVTGVFAQDEATCDAENPVLFGFVVDNTGVGAIFAASQFKGMDIAMADLNATGGILGRCVKYIWQDSELDATKGATIAEQFVLEDNVDFLVGPTSSGVALAITEIARENEVPVVFHTSNTVQLTTTAWHPFMVQVVPHTTIEARAVAQFAANNTDFELWGSIGPDYSFGRDSYGAFEPRFMDLATNAEIITQQWPALSDRDMNPFLTALEAQAPDAIYSSLWGDQLVTFIGAADEFGLFDEANFFGLLDTDVLKAMGEDLPEGLYGYARAPFYAIDTEAMADFNERYFAMYEEYPSDWAIMLYDGVMALAAAAEEAGSVEGVPVSEALSGLTFDALRGELTIRECDHMANVGEYVGISTQDSPYGIPILRDVAYIPAEEVWDSCEDIEAMRAEAGGE